MVQSYRHPKCSFKFVRSISMYVIKRVTKTSTASEITMSIENNLYGNHKRRKYPWENILFIKLQAQCWLWNVTQHFWGVKESGKKNSIWKFQRFLLFSFSKGNDLLCCYFLNPWMAKSFKMRKLELIRLWWNGYCVSLKDQLPEISAHIMNESFPYIHSFVGNSHILSNYMFHLKSFTHNAPRQEYQFHFYVILPPVQNMTQNLILIPRKLSSEKDWWMFAWKIVCMHVVYLDGSKHLNVKDWWLWDKSPEQEFSSTDAKLL